MEVMVAIGEIGFFRMAFSKMLIYSTDWEELGMRCFLRLRE